MLTLEKFKQASAIVKEVTLPTKLVYSEYLSKQTGADVYLKPENMQYTGAYKVRGAYYKISTMSEEDRKKGLVTASAGNHAQGVAYAAKKFGCKATVVMPTVTPLIKVNRTKSYGAGQFRIHDCKARSSIVIAVSSLDPAVFFCNNRRITHLTSCRCNSQYNTNRKTSCCLALFVIKIPYVPFIGNSISDCFCRIDRTSAAYSKDEIYSFFFRELDSFIYQ